MFFLYKRVSQSTFILLWRMRDIIFTSCVATMKGALCFSNINVYCTYLLLYCVCVCCIVWVCVCVVVVVGVNCVRLTHHHSLNRLVFKVIANKEAYALVCLQLQSIDNIQFFQKKNKNKKRICCNYIANKFLNKN